MAYCFESTVIYVSDSIEIDVSSNSVRAIIYSSVQFYFSP
jgi:hypothetical protein